MLRKITVATLLLVLSVVTTSAQSCNSVPNTLTNGTTADATQVMANFNAIVACFGGLRGYLAGLTTSNDATNPSTVIDTSSGLADSDDSSAMMTVAQALTKNANSAWASGTGNGCLDSGSALAANQWYHLFVIENATSSAVDELCSASATSPALPSGYTKKRRIGSFETDGNSHILAFIQVGDNFLWAVPVQSVSQPIADTNGHLVSLNVPPGAPVEAFIGVQYQATVTGSPALYVSSSLQADVPFSASAFTMQTNTTGLVSWSGKILTNTSQQIRYRSSTGASGTAISITTNGWIDTRGRFN